MENNLKNGNLYYARLRKIKNYLELKQINK